MKSDFWNVKIGRVPNLKWESPGLSERMKQRNSPPMKQIFITSFNLFKKALTYDEICHKVSAQNKEYE